MFRSSTIIRELALNLAKVIFMLKHSVKLRRYLFCGCVAACCNTTAYLRALSLVSSNFLTTGECFTLKMEKFALPKRQ